MFKIYGIIQIPQISLIFQLVAGTNWKFKTINELRCEEASSYDEPSDAHTTTACYDIESFVPLPCATDEESSTCNPKQMYVTGFKKCEEKVLRKTHANIKNVCV